MIYIAGISIALFISALLLNKKNKSKSDIILFIWMLLMAFHLYLFYTIYTGTIYNTPHLLGIHFPFPLLQSVFLYYYVSSVTNHFPKKIWISLLHIIPTLATYIYLIPFFNLPGTEKLLFLENKAEGFQTFMTVGLILINISGVAYVTWSSILLRKHKKNIRDQFSDIEAINLKWLQFLTLGIGVIWCIVIFSNNDRYIFTGVAVFVILIGFFGVQQRDVFSPIKTNFKSALQNPIAFNEKKEKYATSGLTDELGESLYKKLIQLIINEASYKKNDLSLNDLASELEIHPNYLSQIINEKEGKTFYDFINIFRVEEFKRLVEIPENKQFTLLALAYDCGFNSKSSFNRYFKKNTGLTPSQYAKSLKS